MEDDELEYIYMTTNGLLWDVICQEHPDMDRRDVKVEMFRAVFYSHSPVSDKWNDYAKLFKERFPNVFRLIGDWKRVRLRENVKMYMSEHHLPTNKGTASLSIAMMALEADIFTSILKRLYAKRWHAVHIHDCIVVPADNFKNHPQFGQVQEIMEGVYGEYGLCPTFSKE